MKTNPYKPPKCEEDCRTKEYMDDLTVEWFRKYNKFIIVFDIFLGLLIGILVVAIILGLIL